MAMDQSTILALKVFVKKCLRIQSQLALETRVLTPKNLISERNQFMASPSYNPQFEYQKKEIDISEEDLSVLLEELNQLGLPEDLRSFYESTIVQMQNQLKTIHSIGTKNFAAFSSRLFGLTPEVFKQYLDLVPEVEFNTKTGDKLLDAPTIQKYFSKVVDDYYFDVEVVLDDFNPFTVRVGSKKLVVGSGIRRYKNNVERLVTHEIESHIIRRKSLLQMKNPLHRLAPFDRSILYSEGLAVYNEISQKKITKSAMNTYLQRLQAVSKLELSFRAIYTYLLNFMTPQLAFVMTYRVKRGMPDTSLPGGYEKDAYYLMGYFAVKDYVDKGGHLKDLYTFAVPELGVLLRKYNLASDKEPLLPKFLQ